MLDANFHPGRTGRNHLRVLAATAGVTDRRVDELLERVGLTDGRAGGRPGSTPSACASGSPSRPR